MLATKLLRLIAGTLYGTSSKGCAVVKQTLLAMTAHDILDKARLDGQGVISK